MDDFLLDINDLAKELKIPVKTIRNKLSNGTFPLEPTRIGRALRWRPSNVERLKRGEMPPANGGAEA
jgi:predicted DNA-binding transcriptional regulator AlpA